MSSASYNNTKKKTKHKHNQSSHNEFTPKTASAFMQDLQGSSAQQDSENIPFDKNSTVNAKSKMDEYYNLINKLSLGSGASELRVNPKDEKMHLKTMRTFFFLQAIGFTCRLRKVPNEDEFEQALREQESSGGPASQLVIEGILYSCDANSTHIILEQATILKVYGDDPYSPTARTELIRRAERASVNLSEVKEIRFDGLDITKNGMVPLVTTPQQIETPEEELEPSQAKVEEGQSTSQVQRPLALQTQQKEPAKEESQAQILEKAVSPAKASTSAFEGSSASTKFKDQNSPSKKVPESPGKKRIAPSPKIVESSPKQKQPQSPKRSAKKVPKSPHVSTFTIQPEIDEAIVIEKPVVETDKKGEKDTKTPLQPKSGKSSRVNTPRAPKTPKKQKSLKQQQEGNQRELVRFKSDKKMDSAKQDTIQMSLEDESKDAEEGTSKPFDQFKDRKTTYDFSMYTSTFDESKVTSEQRQIAEQVEQEIKKDPLSKKMANLEEGSDDNDEEKFSSVIRQETEEQNEEKVETDERSSNASMKQNQESMEMFKRGLMSKVQSKKARDDLAQNKEVLQSFKAQVLNKLSPPSKSKKAESIVVPEKIKVRSYDPDGDSKEDLPENKQNKQIPEKEQITQQQQITSDSTVPSIVEDPISSSGNQQNLELDTQVTDSNENKTDEASQPAAANKSFQKKQFTCINRAKGIAGTFQEHYSLMQHQKVMNLRQEQAKVQAKRHNEQQKHVQELGKVLVPGMASQVQTLTPSIHFSQYLAKELVSDTWRASNKQR